MKYRIPALALAAAVALPAIALAHRITPPAVPAEIAAPAGQKPFLIAHATGTQGYMCVAVGKTFSWATFGPQATLFGDENRQILTHFLSPNPYEHGALYPTWQHSRDTSAVWATPIASTSDPNVVAPGASPWLLLQEVATQPGSTGGDTLTRTTYIQRVHTVGGSAPGTGCRTAQDIKKRALVPYEADYVFYTARAQDGRDDD